MNKIKEDSKRLKKVIHLVATHRWITFLVSG